MKIKSGYGFNTALIAEGLMNVPALSCMYLFSGTMPTSAQITSYLLGGSALYSNYGGTVRVSELLDSLTDAVPLVYARYNSQIKPVYKSPDRFTLPLTATSEQGLVLNAGTPTWFMYAVMNNTNNATVYEMIGGTETRPDNAGGFISGFTVFGTVGNESSTADMKIVGGAVTTGTPYKFLDLDITINSPA